MDPTFDNMESRHSSPSSNSPRPSTHRKRSNSVPTRVMEALGCSTAEAEMILAEGRAAIHRRRGRHMGNDKDVYRPRDHMKFLDANLVVSGKAREDSMSVEDRKSFRHSRFPSDVTDSSIVTVVAAVEPPSTLGNYSANLAQFIKAQMRSIPSYKHTQLPISPCSCPDLSYSSRTPPLSPTRSIRRPTEAPNMIAIPPVRPPMQSAFSEWSSADDETDDERPAMPHSDSSTRNYTSVPRYYDNSADSSFLFSSTPLVQEDPDTADGFSFPNQFEYPESSKDTPSHGHDSYHSPALSTHPQLTSSSAPSFSSVSTGEYFDFKLNPQMRARIIAAVTPPQPQVPNKINTSISPFDGAALSSIHDVLVETQNRVLIDGMSFDMLRELNVPNEGMRRVQTPC